MLKRLHTNLICISPLYYWTLSGIYFDFVKTNLLTFCRHEERLLAVVFAPASVITVSCLEERDLGLPAYLLTLFAPVDMKKSVGTSFRRGFV